MIEVGYSSICKPNWCTESIETGGHPDGLAANTCFCDEEKRNMTLLTLFRPFDCVLRKAKSTASTRSGPMRPNLPTMGSRMSDRGYIRRARRRRRYRGSK